MAELSLPQGRSGSRQSARLPIRVDLTALVDLAFLLITFFMLTTTLQKNREMELVMPVNQGHEAVPASRTMTVCLGKTSAVYYMGMAEKPLTAPKTIDYGNQMNNALLTLSKQIRAASGKDMIVVIKPSDRSIYKNVVATLDEMHLANIQSYAIAAIAPKDIEIMKLKGAY